jgi:hypothetical protein
VFAKFFCVKFDVLCGHPPAQKLEDFPSDPRRNALKVFRVACER